MNNSQTISFWNFLSGHSIEIPIIQRDYAQGRRGKEELRKGFLANLRTALDDKSTVLKLDFVYGASKKKQLNPLDGQQRLTTLWLLHWYIALRANVLGECYETLRKFTYETRVSSRDFCEQLCNADNFRNFGGDDVAGYIKRQTWFYSAWKQDPTILSMLRMLSGTDSETQEDGIEKVFGSSNFEEYWNLLCGNDCPIQFYYLPLENFGLSDDLYIKMNARGKQLTSFENFKADIIGYITEQAKTSSPEWDGLLNPENGLPVNMDTKWTDIFWDEKAKDCRIDEIYFAFINRFFWNELFTGKNGENYILDIGKGDDISKKENQNSSYWYLNDSENSNDYDTRISYKGLGKYRYLDGEIPFKTFEKLNKVLDNYLEIRCSRSVKDGKPIIPECAWDSGFKFIPSYVKDVNGENVVVKNNSNESIYQITYLNQVHRVVFYAVCKFLNEYDANQEGMYCQLERWIRVVWNLVSSEGIDGRPIIRSTQAMRAAIELIQKLDVRDVYASLVKLKENKAGTSEVENRLKEEIVKAEKINEEPEWEEKLREAEKLFKGGIRFLYHDESDKVKWEDFDSKLNAVKKYFDFDENCIREEYKIKFIKAFVVQNTIRDICDKELFNPKLSTWNWVLNNSAYAKSVPAVLLTENLDNIMPLNGGGNENSTSADWPFKFMIEDGMFGGRGRFHQMANVWAFYKPYGQNALLLDQHGFARNRLLCSLLDKAQIFNIGVDDSNFFTGWDIKFCYGGYALIWKHDNKIYSDDLFGALCADANGVCELNEMIQRLDKGIEEMNARKK